MKKYIDEMIQNIDELIEIQKEKISFEEINIQKNNIIIFEEIKKMLNKIII